MSRYRRNPSSLADLGSAWVSVGPTRGAQSAGALTSFLRGRTPHTQRSYQFAVLDFWRWLAQRRGRVLLPDEVLPDDARAYADHLLERRDGGALTKLVDTGRDLDARIYRYLLDRPGSSVSNIASALSVASYELPNLQQQLDKLVVQNVLERSPRIEELRKQPEYTRLDVEPDPAIFRYRVRLQQTEPALRTALTRLHALGSFWSELHLSKVALSDPWPSVIRPLALRASQERTPARRMPTELARRLWEVASGPSVQSTRDRALLALLTLPDLRVQHLVALRRSDWDGDVLHVGERDVPLPALARAALEDLSSKLLELEQDRSKRGKPERGLLDQAAPLVPAIGYWGAHASQDPLRSMRPYAVTQALHALAERAGITRGSAEFKLVHAAALRRVALSTPGQEAA